MRTRKLECVAKIFVGDWALSIASGSIARSDIANRALVADTMSAASRVPEAGTT